MAEYDLNEREDRLVVFWLAALAIIVVFVVILTST
jgi:hypothetical protein